MKTLVFTEEQNERLKYTFDFIFDKRGMSYELTSDRDQFNSFEGAKLNYSSEDFGAAIQVVPATLLFQKGVHKQNLSLQIFNDWECLGFEGVTDVIASIFCVLTCYESYDSKKNDSHGRFQFESSILNLFGWIDKAVCDRWALSLIKLIDPESHSKIIAQEADRAPLIVPTFDIDNAFAYKYKKGKRKWLSILRDILNGDRQRLRERRLVNSGKLRDPYDSYDRIKEVAGTFPETRVFWLMKSDGEYDRNLSPTIEEYRKLIKEISDITHVGIHPSYASFLNSDLVKLEKQTLEDITGVMVAESRQHFLKLQLPQSYQTLIDSGVTEDHSMGFAEHFGFRAGTADSFYWYDIQNDIQTDLLVHPFVYMDGTLHEYMGLDQEASKMRIKALYKEVCQYGGAFRFIWHNETISNYGKWDGWSEVLDFTLNLRDE